MKATQFIKTFALATMVTVFASSAMAQMSHTETVKAFYDAYNKHDPSLLDKVLADNWQDIPPNPGQKIGREAFKPYVANADKVFGNLHITNDDIMESGNKVIVRSTVEATQVGTFAGFPASKRPIKIMAIDIHEFNDKGRVVKTWHLENWLAALYQIGALGK